MECGGLAWAVATGFDFNEKVDLLKENHYKSVFNSFFFGKKFKSGVRGFHPFSVLKITARPTVRGTNAGLKKQFLQFVV